MSEAEQQPSTSAAEQQPRGRLAEIRETPLSVDECLAAVRRPEAGGIALFLGAVRDHNQGQQVDRLEYEAYRSMAEKELSALLDELEAEFAGVRVAAQHRIGALVVGDLAVICAASSAHRDQAFAACRALIDRIKERVPIWKREHGSEGPYWVGWQDARVDPQGQPIAGPPEE